MDEHPPRRRSDDCVSFKDMVDYVATHDETMHTARAETLLYIGRTIERIEHAWEQHEVWHRDFLANSVTQGSNVRVAIVAIIVASLLSAASVAIGIVAVITHK